MTTSMIEETTEETTEEATKERSIDELLKHPYSELTDEEIERVVEWKAGIKARDAAYTERIAAINTNGEKLIAAAQAAYDDALASQQAFAEMAYTNMQASMQAAQALLASVETEKEVEAIEQEETQESGI